MTDYNVNHPNEVKELSLDKLLAWAYDEAQCRLSHGDEMRYAYLMSLVQEVRDLQTVFQKSLFECGDFNDVEVKCG